MGILSPELRPKLQQLIPLLSSDHAGEVAATAAAIGRVLRGAGLDWHDLADDVGTGSKPVVRLGCRDNSASSRLALQWHPDRRFTVARALEEGIVGRSFSEWEATFATSVVDLIRRSNSRLSDKQIGVVNRLLKKISGERA